MCVCVKLEIQIYIKHPPSPSLQQKQREKYTIPQTLNSQCGIRSCPPNRNNDFLPWFLYKSFFYAFWFFIFINSRKKMVRIELAFYVNKKIFVTTIFLIHYINNCLNVYRKIIGFLKEVSSRTF